MRIPWKKILGTSLTNWCQKNFEKGYTKAQTIRYLTTLIYNEYEALRYVGINVDIDRLIECCKIGVTSRYAEYKRNNAYVP